MICRDAHVDYAWRTTVGIDQVAGSAVYHQSRFSESSSIRLDSSPLFGRPKQRVMRQAPHQLTEKHCDRPQHEQVGE